MAEFTGYIPSTDDDGCESDTSTWSTYPSWMGNDTGVLKQAGFRFTSVAVPQGATINSATIRFRADTSTGTVTNVHMKAYGDDVDNAAAWSSTSRPSQITQTTASVDFDPTEWTSGTYYSVTITGIVQEIVSRAGWATGQAMRFAFMDDGSSASCLVRGYDYLDGGGDTYNARLYIDYTEAATAQFARPAADRTDGSWLNSAGTPDNVALYSYIDETSYSDSDYIRSSETPSNDTCTIDLGSISTPEAGTVTIRVRARTV